MGPGSRIEHVNAITQHPLGTARVATVSPPKRCHALCPNAVVSMNCYFVCLSHLRSSIVHEFSKYPDYFTLVIEFFYLLNAVRVFGELCVTFVSMHFCSKCALYNRLQMDVRNNFG